MSLFCKILFSLSLAISLWSCSKDNSEIKSTEIAVPKTIVNLRSGPGTNYGIVKGLTPNDTTYVLSGKGDEWLYVSLKDGKTNGFVSSRYMDIENTIVIHDSSNSVNVNLPFQTVSKDNEFRIDSKLNLLSAWPMFVLNTKNAGGITVVILLIISISICYWLKKRYDYRMNLPRFESKSAIIGYFVIVISMILTLWQIVAIFSIRSEASERDFVYTLMILSTGIPMATIPWRIKISGLSNIRDRSYSNRCYWGEKLGIWGWIILLFPLCVFYLQSSYYQELNMNDDSFEGMFFSLGIFFLISWTFTRFFWPYIIVKYMFKSMNSIVLVCLNIILAIGIGIYGYKMCNLTFTGLTYIISLWALTILMAIILMSPINVINKKRCGNCHNFEGQYVGSSDIESTYKSSTDWKETSTSNIRAKHDGAIVSDAQKKVRTTTRVDKWKTHYSCPYCYEEWDMDHQESTEVGSETLEKKWKETYLR